MENKEKQQSKTPLSLKLIRAAENTAVATQYLLNAIQLDPDRSDKALGLIKRYFEIEEELFKLNGEAFRMKKEWLAQNKKANGKVTKLPKKESGQEENLDQKKVV